MAVLLNPTTLGTFPNAFGYIYIIFLYITIERRITFHSKASAHHTASLSSNRYHLWFLCINKCMAVSEWVTESDRLLKKKMLFSILSVSDPLQRDDNQVHLPAAQCLLAAHHASNQCGGSVQLPRYNREPTNYQTHCSVIYLYLLLKKRQVENRMSERANMCTANEDFCKTWHFTKYTNSNTGLQRENPIPL